MTGLNLRVADPNPSSIGTTNRLPLRMVKAARLIAEDKISLFDIAKKCGVTEYAVSRWRRNFPAFGETVELYRREIALRVYERGIAQKHNRISRLDRTWNKLNTLIEKRAADAVENPDFIGVPGAETGLLVRQRKCIGGGQHGEFINEFVVDHDTLKALNAVEEQASRELGQFQPDGDKGPKGDQHNHVHIHYPTMTDAEQQLAVAAQEADMPPAAKRLLTRPSDGRPLDR